MLKVAIIGLGVGFKHLEALFHHDACHLVAACDFDKARLKEVENRYPDLQTTTSADELFIDPAIDFVSIATYDEYHAQQVINALENQKHVFVEKPICLSLEELKKIKACLLANPHLQLSSNLNLRTCPRFLHLRDQIQQGKLGTPFAIEADYLWGRLFKLTDGWRKDTPGYSVIHGAAVHVIDLICWLLGEKPVEVMGMGNRLCTKGSRFKEDDFSSCLLGFESGVVAKVSANAGCIHPHWHNLSVSGTLGSYIHNVNGAQYIFKKGEEFDFEPDSREYPAKRDRSYLIQSFVDTIIDKSTEEIITQKDVLDIMSICFAAEKSIQTKKNIPISFK